MKAGKKILAIAASAALLGSTAVPAFAGSEFSKEETVYVVTEADGSQSDITVSDHLKNGIGADTIHDVTDLKDIENVKGDETFQKGDDDAITWKAEGNDIFYQGTTSRQAPVRLGISYFLDGEEVDGSALDGASGDVKIVINYRNTAVDSKGTTVPFIAMTGFIAEDDSFTDIDVDHGKVIDDGDKKVVVAMAAPGLNDALDLDPDLVDLDLEDTVTIEGTAKDFAVQDMMTIVTSSLFEDMDSDDFGDLDYDDEISELNKGAKALMKGSDQLYQGINMLYEKMPSLEKGVGALKDGADELSEGTRNAKDGAQKLAGGIGQLADALKNMDSMMQQMYTALAGMEKGTANVISNLKDMKGSLKDSAIPALDQVSSGLSDSASDMEAAAKGAEQVDAYLKSLQNLRSKIGGSDKAVKALMKAGLDEGSAKALVGGLDAAESGASQLQSSLNGAPDKLKEASGALDQVSSGLDKAASGLGSYDSDKGDKQDTIIGGLTVIDGGLKTMKEKVGQLSGGDTPDVSGLSGLVNGANQLAAGEQKLATGAKELAKGMSSLESSSVTLSSGVQKLDKGSLKLSQGMSKLYKDGIRKIVDLYNDDLKGSLDSFEDVIDAGKEYTSFTKLPEGADGSVKFIYKTSVY